MNNKVKYQTWLYANGLFETLDIIDSLSRKRIDWIMTLYRNKFSIWTRVENRLVIMFNLRG